MTPNASNIPCLLAALVAVALLIGFAVCGGQESFVLDAPNRWTRHDHDLYALEVRARLVGVESELEALKSRLHALEGK